MKAKIRQLTQAERKLLPEACEMLTPGDFHHLGVEWDSGSCPRRTAVQVFIRKPRVGNLT